MYSSARTSQFDTFIRAIDIKSLSTESKMFKIKPCGARVRLGVDCVVLIESRVSNEPVSSY